MKPWHWAAVAGIMGLLFLMKRKPSAVTTMLASGVPANDPDFEGVVPAGMPPPQPAKPSGPTTATPIEKVTLTHAPFGTSRDGPFQQTIGSTHPQGYSARATLLPIVKY